jgi:hypothetical protein
MKRSLLFLAVSSTALATLLGCGDPKAVTPPEAKAKWRAEGRAEAEQDLAAWKLRLKTYGLPSEWSWKYQKMAWKKFRVEFEVVAGCGVSDELVQRADGYNERMRREIDRRFGPGALDKLEEAAAAKYRNKQKARRQAKPDPGRETGPPIPTR